MERKTYVSYLTDADIKEMLFGVNYELVTNIMNRKNEKLPAIERQYDEESKEHCIIVRCRQIKSESEEINKLVLPANVVANYLMLLSTINNYSINDRNGFIIITDYEFKEYFVNDIFDEDKNCKEDYEANKDKFAKLFLDKLSEKNPKLGKSYIKDYNEFAKKYNEKIDQTNSEKEL